MSNRRLMHLLVANALVLLIALCLSACKDHDDGPPDFVPPPSATTYSIGGTVAGSTGSLTLQNSNGTMLAVPATGAFTFATPMASGAAYNVTVAVPPSSQSCTVANGSGTVGAANITSIAVTCTTNQYTLGGTVSGLGAGKSVALRASTDGLTTNITVSANGAFTFPDTFVNNAEYLVFVITQPAGQTCTVAPETGDILGASVTTIAVTCIDSSASARNWGTAATIAADEDLQDFDTFRTPEVAFDAAGNALAIWEQDRANAIGTEIFFSRYTAGGSWSAPAMIPNESAPMPGQPSASTRRKPQLAVAANGNAVAAWVENVYAVAVSFYTPGSGWSNPEHIFDNLVNGLGGTIDPTVAIDASGNVLVVWGNHMVNGLSGILYNRYIPGTGWVTPYTVPRLVNELQFPAHDPEIAMLPNGTTVAVWKQSGGGGFNQSQLWSSRYDMAADTWSAPQEVDSQDSGNPLYGHVIQGRNNVMLDAAGNASVVWAQYDGTRMHIVFNHLTGNTWGTPAVVETYDSPVVLQSNAYDPRASIDGSGNIMAMWLQVDGDEGHYVANRYVPGAGWGTQENIGEYVEVGHVANETSFELVSNAAGQTVAVWTLVSGIGAENVPYPVYLSANEYNPTNHSWGAEEVIDRHADFPGDVDGDADSPAVAVDASGNAVAVWVQRSSATVQGIRVNRFE